MAATGLTLFEKIWRRHVVTEGPGGQSLLYVDRHLLHEGSTHAFGRMERKGLAVRRPEGISPGGGRCSRSAGPASP